MFLGALARAKSPPPPCSLLRREHARAEGTWSCYSPGEKAMGLESWAVAFQFLLSRGLFLESFLKRVVLFREITLKLLDLEQPVWDTITSFF